MSCWLCATSGGRDKDSKDREIRSKFQELVDLSGFFQKLAYFLLLAYIVFAGCMFVSVGKAMDHYRNLPVMDQMETSKSGRTRACVVRTVVQDGFIRVELTYAEKNIFSIWEGEDVQPTIKLGIANGAIQYGEMPFLLPRRGDIIEFRQSADLECSPAKYGDLLEVSIIGRATDELLAVCDERWEGFQRP